jgi:lipopolysaccharide/colanic/teichoic acid biosynthesis glycosyltransferase
MRIIDLAASVLGILVLSPLFVVIALLIKLGAPGPVFYRAVRVGKDGAPFRIYKFRSMVVGADKSGPGITTADDRRITRVGQFLRKTKLDELPQLINVLRGEMSLIGPRPEDPRYIMYYTPVQRQVLRVRPGITSPASLLYRDEALLLTGADWEQTYITRIMPQKLALELTYLQQRNLVTDLRLIVLTLWAVIARGNT